MSAIEIRRATADDWQTVRKVRLAALQDAPYAFGSTYETARTYDEARWRSRLDDSNSPTFVAFEGAEAIGMDGAYLEKGEPTLVAMWVDPRARARGVGAALTQAVLDWATARGARRVVLGVADGNHSARRLYERLGFKMTGRSEPLQSDPSRLVREMSREL